MVTGDHGAEIEASAAGLCSEVNNVVAHAHGDGIEPAVAEPASAELTHGAMPTPHDVGSGGTLLKSGVEPEA